MVNLQLNNAEENTMRKFQIREKRKNQKEKTETKFGNSIASMTMNLFLNPAERLIQFIKKKLNVCFVFTLF